MANVLNISSSLEPVVDTTGADIGSQTYTESAVDKNTGSLGALRASTSNPLDFILLGRVTHTKVILDN